MKPNCFFQTCSLYEICSLFIVRCSVFRKSERTLFEVIWSKVDLVSFLSLQVKEIQKRFHQIHHLQLFGSQLDMFCLNVSKISIRYHQTVSLCQGVQALDDKLWTYLWKYFGRLDIIEIYLYWGSSITLNNHDCIILINGYLALFLTNINKSNWTSQPSHLC